MSEVDQLMAVIRASARQLVAGAGKRILAGGDAKRIHDKFVVRAPELLEDAETLAVLAAGDDAEALAAIERVVGELDSLSRELDEAYPD